MRPGIEERGHYIQGVPFYDQNDNSCGPAILSGIISFWGRTADLNGIADVNLTQHLEALPDDLENYLREAGFETVSLTGTLKTLTAKVRQNIPVIALLDIGFASYRIPHYVTVVGFDEVNQVIILHDGITQNKVIAYASFVRYWSKTNFWMMVAVPSSLKRPS